MPDADGFPTKDEQRGLLAEGHSLYLALAPALNGYSANAVAIAMGYIAAEAGTLYEDISTDDFMRLVRHIAEQATERRRKKMI